MNDKKILITFLEFILISKIAEGLKLFNDGNNYGIIGGKDATEGQFPYQVSIQRCGNWPFDQCRHYCGGSIISPSWIVTAGHCYEYGYNYKIVVGILKQSEESEFKQTLEINQTIVHADYIGNSNPNDIRLYQLKTPLVYNERVQPIKLPEQDSHHTGDGVLSGWGYSSDGLFPVTPDTLQYQISNMPDEETCLKLANSIGRNSFNITTNVCTDNPEKDHGICNGDSGGPLTQNGTLIGISSWVFSPCGRKGAPSVFTRVSNYINWINERVSELNISRLIVNN